LGVGVKRGFEVGVVTLGVVRPGAPVLEVFGRGVVLAPVRLAPGFFPPGAVAVPGVVVRGRVLVPVSPVPGVLVVGAVAVGVAVMAGAVVTVVVAGAVVERSEPPARVTRAAASTPRESAARTASARTAGFQEGDAAKRVRAAAPQCKHHSCSK
jgi:multisubunit Na+/H+ antiporter MnhC subunit